jgi:hypothetical protein
MFEGSLQPYDVFLVVRVGLLKLIQHLRFLKTCFIPGIKVRGVDIREKASSHGLLTPDDLDGNLPATIPRFPTDNPGTHHVGKHAFAKGRENLVASAIKLFTEDHRVIPF